MNIDSGFFVPTHATSFIAHPRSGPSAGEEPETTDGHSDQDLYNSPPPPASKECEDSANHE